MSILVLTSDTLIGTPATGNLEYNGQFYGTDSNASRAQLQRITQGTAVTLTTQTNVDFTSLPAWVKKITVLFNGVSVNLSSIIQVQLGTGSTTYTTSGYLGGGWFANTTNASLTTGISVITSGAGAGARTVYGTMTIANLTGNTWVASTTAYDNNGSALVAGSSIALAAVLTAVRITTVNGTDVFDAGTVNILYEG
jgi:hypothetical protein